MNLNSDKGDNFYHILNHYFLKNYITILSISVNSNHQDDLIPIIIHK